MGPCGMMDRMGLRVVHHVATSIDEANPHSEALEYHALHRRESSSSPATWSHERPGLLQLPESNVRSTGLHLTQNRPTHTTGFNVDRPEQCADLSASGLNDHTVRNGAR